MFEVESTVDFVDCEHEIDFFFFKQKTAYEVRISDWSSDVCSSDLALEHDAEEPDRDRRQQQHDPIVQTQVSLAKPGDEGTHHVERAMGEVDDVEQTENDGQAQRKHSIE